MKPCVRPSLSRYPTRKHKKSVVDQQLALLLHIIVCVNYVVVGIIDARTSHYGKDLFLGYIKHNMYQCSSEIPPVNSWNFPYKWQVNRSLDKLHKATALLLISVYTVFEWQVLLVTWTLTGVTEFPVRQQDPVSINTLSIGCNFFLPLQNVTITASIKVWNKENAVILISCVTGRKKTCRGITNYTCVL